HVTVAHLENTVQAVWLSRRPSTIGLGVTAYRFSRNPIKSWQSYQVEVSQPLLKSAFQTTIGLSYEYVPYFYYRNLRSYWTASELGVLPPPRREATYKRNEAAIVLDQIVVPRYLQLSGRLGEEARDYNRCFEERDSRMRYRQLDLSWDPF